MIDMNEGCHENDLQGSSRCSKTIAGTLSLNNAGGLDENISLNYAAAVLLCICECMKVTGGVASDVQRAGMYC